MHDDTRGDIRRKGLALFAAAFAGGVALAAALHYLALPAWRPVIMIVALPFAFSLAGLSQFITGVRFTQLSAQWNSLQGWQRGVLGVLFVAAFSGVLFSAIVAVLVSGEP